MSSFKPPMGEGNTGNFDTPFGGKAAPSGEFAPPIPPAPKAEGAYSGAFTPPVPKTEGAAFTPPVPPKGEGKAFTPPVPPAPNEPEEPHTPQEDDKGGKGKDKKDATKSSGRGDSGRPKSTRRMWPWIAAVAVVAVVSGVLGYGYFANEGNNPVGEKLGFSHAKVTDQSTSDPNNGSYANPSGDANSSQQGQEGSTDDQKSQEGDSNVVTRPADDVLKDGDYGKELVNTALDPRTLPETEEARSLKLNVKYKPNRTMQSFLDDCVKFNSDFKTYTGLKDDPNKLWIVTGDARVKYDVSTDTNVDTDDSVKYEYANNSLRMVAMLLAAAYQSGVPDPSADVVVAYALGGKRAVIRGFSLHNSFESYRYKINDTDPELWVQAVYPDGVPEGVQLPPVPAE